jgi:hypothetical protein
VVAANLREHDLEQHDLEQRGDFDSLECALDAVVDLLQRAIRVATPDTVSGDRAPVESRERR